MTPGKPLVWAPSFQPPLGSRPELRDIVQASHRSSPESSFAGETKSGHSHNDLHIRVMEKSSEKEFIKATVISPTKIQQNVVRLQSHNKNHSMQRTPPGGPVLKNLPCNTGDTGLIPGLGTKIPHASRQQSPAGWNFWAQAPQLESPCTKRVRVPQRKISHSTAKMQHSQINKINK